MLSACKDRNNKTGGAPGYTVLCGHQEVQHKDGNLMELCDIQVQYTAQVPTAPTGASHIHTGDTGGDCSIEGKGPILQASTK